MKKKNILLIFLLGPLLFSFFSACMKNPSFSVDKGTPASCTDIDNALNNMQRTSISAIKNNEQVSIESYTLIDGPFKTLNLTQNQTITVLTGGDPNTLSISLRNNATENVGGGWKKWSSEGNYEISLDGSSSQTQSVNKANLPKAVSGPITMSSFHNKMSLTAAAASDGTFCSAQADGTVYSYNNLQITHSNQPVPTPVAANSNWCGNGNCPALINTEVLQFDRWVDDPNSVGQQMKVTTYITTSSDVPFLASLLSQCMQYSWPTPSANGSATDLTSPGPLVLVTTCDDVASFQFGTN